MKLISFSFIVFCLFSAFVGWLSGYNFDKRDGDVAMWVLATVMLAGVFSASMVQLDKENKK